MEQDPVEPAPGKLGYPECRRPLEPGPVPVCRDGARIGAFGGIGCSACGYGLLTEKGHCEKGPAPEALGCVPLSYPLDSAA